MQGILKFRSGTDARDNKQSRHPFEPTTHGPPPHLSQQHKALTKLYTRIWRHTLISQSKNLRNDRRKQDANSHCVYTTDSYTCWVLLPQGLTRAFNKQLTQCNSLTHSLTHIHTQNAKKKTKHHGLFGSTQPPSDPSMYQGPQNPPSP